MAKDSRLSPKALYESLIENDVNFFCGVPDSIVSAFSLFLEARAKQQHFIASSEGNAIGLAIGYHVATAAVPLVYMQNSGLSNAVDPLVSLADPSVLSVPMVLLIGWRGQPGKKDEPQHAKQGAITGDLLRMLGITYVVLSRQADEAALQISKAAKASRKSKSPYAVLVEKDTFDEYKYDVRPLSNYSLSREEAMQCVMSNICGSGVVVAGIGKISRELFEYRGSQLQGHEKDLLIVGGMGHASSVALGIATEKPGTKVYCLDGDGSVLMHMGSLATIGVKQPKNLLHIIFNNGLYDSVGGQPTAGFEVELTAIAKACGYSQVFSISEAVNIKDLLESASKLDGPVMIEVRIHAGARQDLGRPTILPQDNKHDFMNFLDGL